MWWCLAGCGVSKRGLARRSPVACRGIHSFSVNLLLVESESNCAYVAQWPLGWRGFTACSRRCVGVMFGCDLANNYACQ